MNVDESKTELKELQGLENDCLKLYHGTRSIMVRATKEKSRRSLADAESELHSAVLRLHEAVIEAQREGNKS